MGFLRQKAESCKVYHYNLPSNKEALIGKPIDLLKGLGFPKPIAIRNSQKMLKAQDALLPSVHFVQVGSQLEDARSWLQEHPDYRTDRLAVVLIGKKPNDPSERQKLLKLGAFAYLHDEMPENVQQIILQALKRWQINEKVVEDTEFFVKQYTALATFQDTANLLIEYVYKQLQANLVQLLEPTPPKDRSFDIRAEYPKDQGTIQQQVFRGPDKGMSILAANSREIVAVPCIDDSEIYDPEVEPKMKAAVAVPLFVGDCAQDEVLVGVLSMYWDNPFYPTPTEFRRLRALANMTAVTLRMVQQQQLLTESLRPLISQIDAKQEFNRMASELVITPLVCNISRMLGHRRIAVRLLKDAGRRLSIMRKPDTPWDIEGLAEEPHLQYLLDAFSTPWDESINNNVGCNDGPKPRLLTLRTKSSGQEVQFSNFLLCGENNSAMAFGDILIEEPKAESEKKRDKSNDITELKLKQALVRKLSDELTTLRRWHDEKIIDKSTSVIHDSGNRDEVLKAIGECLQKNFHCNGVRIFLVFRRNRRHLLELFYHTSLDAGHHASFELGSTWQHPDDSPQNGVHQFCILQKKWILIPDLGDPLEKGWRDCYIEGEDNLNRILWISDPLLKSLDPDNSLPVTSLKSLIVVPIQRGGKIIGTIELSREPNNPPFLVHQDPQRLTWFVERLTEPLNHIRLEEHSAMDLKHIAKMADHLTHCSEDELEDDILYCARSLSGAVLALLFRKDENPVQKSHDLVLRHASMSRGIKGLTNEDSPLIGRNVGLVPARIPYEEEEKDHWQQLIENYIHLPDVSSFLNQFEIETPVQYHFLWDVPHDGGAQTGHDSNKNLLGVVVLFKNHRDPFAHTEFDTPSPFLTTYLARAGALLHSHEEILLARVTDRFFDERRKLDEDLEHGLKALRNTVAHLAYKCCNAQAVILYRLSEKRAEIVAFDSGSHSELHPENISKNNGIVLSIDDPLWEVFRKDQPIRIHDLFNQQKGIQISEESRKKLEGLLGEEFVSSLAMADQSHDFLLQVINRRAAWNPKRTDFPTRPLAEAFTSLDARVLKRLVELAGQAHDAFRKFDEYSHYKEMLAIFTHAVKIPIHVMSSHCQMLRDVFEEQVISLPIEAEDCLVTMEREASIARSSIAFNSRFLKENYQIFKKKHDLASLIRKCIARFRVMASDLKVEIHTIPDQLTDASFQTLLHFDKDAIEIILTNLLDNALKYSYSPSYITLELRQVAKGKGIEVLIEDVGHGFPERKDDLTFSPFLPFTRGDVRYSKRPISGTGIGLYVSLQLARAHGGELELVENQKIGEERSKRPAPHRVRFRLFLPDRKD